MQVINPELLRIKVRDFGGYYDPVDPYTGRLFAFNLDGADVYKVADIEDIQSIILNKICLMTYILDKGTYWVALRVFDNIDSLIIDVRED